jgi:hypothetical protein
MNSVAHASFHRVLLSLFFFPESTFLPRKSAAKLVTRVHFLGYVWETIICRGHVADVFRCWKCPGLLYLLFVGFLLEDEAGCLFRIQATTLVTKLLLLFLPPRPLNDVSPGTLLLHILYPTGTYDIYT